jgi:hypothetical protein
VATSLWTARRWPAFPEVAAAERTLTITQFPPSAPAVDSPPSAAAPAVDSPPSAAPTTAASTPAAPATAAPTTAAPAAVPTTAAPAPPVASPPAPRRLRITRQILLIAVFYGAYTVVRDLRGTQPVSALIARHNAERIISLEKLLGLYHEAQIQHALLNYRVVVQLLDDWYGSAHFLVTAGVLVALFFSRQQLYVRWRNALAVATGLALIGFAVFPVMPPRLLPASFGFTDTLQKVGGLWNFESGPMPHLSDQFAAMPSLHFAWALWCGAALWALASRRWLRVLAVCYPTLTFVCVIVTANHFFADVVAGALIVVAGYWAARGMERVRTARTGPIPALQPAAGGAV